MSLWHKGGFHAGKGSITGAGVSNIIPPIIDSFFHSITVSLSESRTSSAPLYIGGRREEMYCNVVFSPPKIGTAVKT